MFEKLTLRGGVNLTFEKVSVNLIFKKLIYCQGLCSVNFIFEKLTVRGGIVSVNLTFRKLSVTLHCICIYYLYFLFFTFWSTPLFLQ